MKKLLAVLVLVTILLPVSLFARETVILDMVPKAYSLEYGTIDFEFETHDVLTDWKASDNGIDIGLGVYPGLEIGAVVYKPKYDKYGYALDAKYSIALDEEQNIAFGVYNVTVGEKAVPYLVYGKSLDFDKFDAGITAGVNREDSEYRFLLALECEYNDIYADFAVNLGNGAQSTIEVGYNLDKITPYIGMHNYSKAAYTNGYIGAVYQVSDPFSVEARFIFPNYGKSSAFINLTYLTNIFN